LLGFPSPVLATCCVCLAHGPLPSPGITRLFQRLGASPPPTRRDRPVASNGRPVDLPDHAWRLCPCCVRLSYVYMPPATTPGAARWGYSSAHTHPSVSSLPRNQLSGPACTSSFSRIARRSTSRCGPGTTRAVTKFVTVIPEASVTLVTSMPAPVASGGSGRRAGVCTRETRRCPGGTRRAETIYARPGLQGGHRGAYLKRGHPSLWPRRCLIPPRCCRETPTASIRLLSASATRGALPKGPARQADSPPPAPIAFANLSTLYTAIGAQDLKRGWHSRGALRIQHG